MQISLIPPAQEGQPPAQPLTQQENRIPRISLEEKESAARSQQLLDFFEDGGGVVGIEEVTGDNVVERAPPQFARQASELHPLDGGGGR